MIFQISPKKNIFFRHALDTSKDRGMTLVETIIYIFILTLLLGVIVSSLISFTRSSIALQAGRDVENSAASAFERMTRDIRDAKNIDLGGSIFNISPGTISLNILDENGNSKTIQFYLDGQILHIKENGTNIGSLTRSSAKITNMVFQQISNSLSKAIRISMTRESGSGSSYKSANFYDTVVLRNSYSTQ